MFLIIDGVEGGTMRHPLVVSLILLMFAAGGSQAITEARRVPPPSVAIAVAPAPGSVRARPDRHVRVTAAKGTLTSVRVSVGGVRVPGRFDRARRAWRSSWTLVPGASYVVSAAASPVRPGDRPAALVATFHTRPAPRAFGVQEAVPSPGETVGVGMPIILTFTTPVRHRAAVERALEVRASRTPHYSSPGLDDDVPGLRPDADGDVPGATAPAGRRVEGAWRWLGESQVVYRPRALWPARRRVTLTAHLAGVHAAPRTYGTADHTLRFSIGRRQTSVVNTRTHQMRVLRDGRLVQRMAISAGKGSTREYTTTSGVHLTMDKGDPVRMVSPGRHKGQPGYYDRMIDHAVRISNSGEYVHALGNVWAQGRINVSHGCVNARPDQAKWFFDHSLRGDPVTVTGTDRPLEWWNGWGFWQLPWPQWRQGSALHPPSPRAG
ncbi:lipoprotein [Sphaerisporangium krabiense]|uniref:Lipoprotein-anchoring transpeptidase ErfK/SrfK n=1 Tax=Sphaerisporangium krabiense TaxID=763782 RepID=A0A7W9DQ19_9ACTN|nr:Ig-like domain-containing protein [Sphaerisporangium krabiense]MBB5627082.1 lipoprotein-anchoring transpeptidase ErfK/SrfK [Sphaerisporangium krabiense]GII65236.1 lipoprotein [Sphaerisporangium krabiense]